MKKTLFILSLQVLSLSCNNDVKTGFPEETKNIAESKNKKYFVSEYKPSKSDFNVNGKIYKIKEVWSEEAWTYKNTDMDEEKLNFKHFLILFNQDWIEGIDYKNEDFQNNGYGFRREKMRFLIKENYVKKDSIKLYFFINKDTIPVYFVKKK